MRIPAHMNSDFQVSLVSVMSVSLPDRVVPLQRPLRQELVGGDGHRPDELSVHVVLVLHLEDQLLGEVAHLHAVVLVPLRVQAVGHDAGNKCRRSM